MTCQSSPYKPSNKTILRVYQIRIIPVLSAAVVNSVNETKSPQRYCCSFFPPAATGRFLRAHHLDARTVTPTLVRVIVRM